MKLNIPITNNESDKFKTQRSYSIEEIFAAGGPTVFGRIRGQNNKTLIEALKSAPEIDPFTEEEWADLMKQLEKDK